MRKRLPKIGSSGSVLVEYVVLCCFLGAVIVFALHQGFWNPSDGYVGFGRDFVRFHRLRLWALSLPIP